MNASSGEEKRRGERDGQEKEMQNEWHVNCTHAKHAGKDEKEERKQR